MGGDYGIRWIEAAGREGRLVAKERFFRTDAARTRFAERLAERDGFVEILAWSDPRVTHH